ncbi:hypothetical protein EDB81DRAFT_701170 [Dactylonectria macrodidyma]|uniref:Uncharacterized protein n=1 Tax=Dactylonectria macrodidyma TaxID=307937 RepID=A0A9P9DHU1_9HYPO|nr:hypothetical protein EDB81DRAFT_701170 [Dactylonectria macrodidyma]
MSSNEVHRFLVNQETVQELSKARSQSYTEIRQVTKSTWKSSHPHHSASTPVARTNSEASLYIPVRRRSIIQTPGVATRSQQTTQRLSSRLSFRNSLPPTPSQSRHHSIESIAARRMSMPPAQVALEPCEAEYKQLGGMKFGSLRITNGAPELTPSPATADPDEVQNEEGLHTASSKSVLKVVNPAGGTETSCDIKSPTKAVETRLSHEQVDDTRKLKLNTSPIESASPTTLLQITSKRSASDDQLLEEDGTIPEYSAGEGLDIRDDPNAKANSERIRLELKHKTVKTLARSDSGFVSSPSSEMSRKVLSKADSGYSPNVSLRSLRSLKPLATDKTLVSSEKPTSEVPERRISGHCGPTSAGRARYTRKHDRSKSELSAPPPPPPKDDVSAIPGRRSSLSSLARDTINRISTLTTSKLSDSSSSRTGTMSNSELAIANPAKPDLPTSEINGNANHTGKLQRLLGGERANGPPRVHEDPPIDQCIPSVPSHAQRRARKHKRRASTAPHRHSPRAKLSKETLRTILSVGSTDMLQNGETSHANDTQPQPAHGTSKLGTTRKRSLYSISHSFAQATTNLLPSNKSVSRSKSATRKNVELEDTHPKTILDHEARASGLHNVQRSMGNSTFGQAFTAITADRSSSFPMRRKTLTKMHPMERRSKKQIRSLPLKTQKSSPNVATTEAWPLSQSIAELAHVEKSKTLPPVSMHIPSIKNLRVPSPGRSRSAAPSETPLVPRSSVSRHSSQESIHSHRSTQDSSRPSHSPLPPILDSRLCSEQSRGPQGRGQTLWHARSGSQPLKQMSKPRRGSAPDQGTAGNHSIVQPGTAVPYPDPYNGQRRRHRSRSDGQNASPTWPPNHPSQTQLQELWISNQPHRQLDRYAPNNSQGHSRHGSGSSAYGQNPPFRILHSYNSPAYRGVPFWG